MIQQLMRVGIIIMVKKIFVTIFIENKFQIRVKQPKMLYPEKKTVFIYEFSSKNNIITTKKTNFICWHRIYYDDFYVLFLVITLKLLLSEKFCF